MKSTQRVRRMVLTDTLTLASNAIIRRKLGNEYMTIDVDEIARLDVTRLYEVLTTTKAVTAAETGKQFILNTATAFVTTLPTPALGLEFWFRVGATEPTTSHTVVTSGSANIIVGNITSPEDAAGSVSVVADADTISFIASKALHGDFAHVWSDGTNWYLDGMCAVQDGMTTTQAT